MNPNPFTEEDSFFLKTLKEEGISEIYLPSKVMEPASKPAGSVSTHESSNKKSVRDELIRFRESVLGCTKCQELSAKRAHVVFGSGNIKAKLMFVGEAPGHEEDLEGLPFVGAAGQLLTKIIESIGLERKQVFIANVLKCRPPQNRSPQPEEIANCSPYLLKQIDLIQPRILCCLGTFAAQTLLKTPTPISQLRGKFYDFGQARLICTYHPAYLLRNPGEKIKVWEDMKKIRKELELLPS